MSSDGVDREDKGGGVRAGHRFPALAQPYATALSDAVAFLWSRFEDLTAIVACGSIIRGNPHATSDLDLFVIRSRLERQRIQRCFNGVPAEIFVNPPAAVRKYFRDERATACPITAHMLSTGFLVYDRESMGAHLIAEAQRQLSLPPPSDPDTLTLNRYLTADLFDNARDMLASDRDTALVFLNEAVRRTVDFIYLNAGRYLPRPKERLILLDAWQPALGQLARSYYRAADDQERWQAAQSLGAEVLGETGFFEWESALDPVEDDE